LLYKFGYLGIDNLGIWGYNGFGDYDRLR
jgi:hypothetical protein